MRRSAVNAIKPAMMAAAFGGLVLLAWPAAAAQILYAELVPWPGGLVSVNADILTETLAGVADKQIRVLRVGIGGDADAASGPIGYRAIGGGLDFTWAAGQAISGPAPTYALDPTTPTNAGSGRGFTYSGELSLLLEVGQALSIYSDYRLDGDGRYAFGTDLLGNSYDDSGSPSSHRPWVLYEYVDARVPEPGTWAMMILGFASTGAALRRRRGAQAASRA